MEKYPCVRINLSHTKYNKEEGVELRGGSIFNQIKQGGEMADRQAFSGTTDQTHTRGLPATAHGDGGDSVRPPRCGALGAAPSCRRAGVCDWAPLAPKTGAGWTGTGGGAAPEPLRCTCGGRASHAPQ